MDKIEVPDELRCCDCCDGSNVEFFLEDRKHVFMICPDCCAFGTMTIKELMKGIEWIKTLEKKEKCGGVSV